MPDQTFRERLEDQYVDTVLHAKERLVGDEVFMAGASAALEIAADVLDSGVLMRTFNDEEVNVTCGWGADELRRLATEVRDVR